MTTENTRKQVGTQLNTQLYTRLRALAVLQGRRVGALIDDAIAAYLAAHERTHTVASRTRAPGPKRAGA
jgi:hypothetical protein